VRGRGASKLLLVVEAVIVAMAAPVGCAQANNVASLVNSPIVTPKSGDLKLVEEQYDSARALQDCLKVKGIESITTPVISDSFDGLDFLSVTPRPRSDRYAVFDPFTVGFSSGDVPEYDRALAARPRPPLFIDGTQDRSAEYAECIDQSAYFIPSRPVDPVKEKKAKEELAAISNEWAQCARDNGWPSVKDAPVVIDGYDTLPTIILPATTSPDSLKALLDRCPYVDPNHPSFNGNQGETPDYLPAPKADFDLAWDDPARDDLKAVLDQYLSEHVPQAGPVGG
jgi:hypothetical protein